MNTKTITVYGLCFLVLQAIINCGIFVTFPQMAAYAVPKEQFKMILDDLKEIKQSQQIIINELIQNKG